MEELVEGINEVRELSLFSGYGGFGLGLRLAGLNIRTVGYVEIDPYCQELLRGRIRDRFLDWAPIITNIRAADFRPMAGMVDIITAGFPCQPHSVAGLQRGANDERNLWPDTLRVIREVGPRYVLLENVPGLLSASSDGGRPAYGGTVVGELASLGYSVHWQTIGADDVGAPHRRKRWWCIAVANTSSTGTGDKPRASGRGAGSQDVRQGDGTLGPVWPDPTGADAGLADSSYEGLEGGIGDPGGEERQTGAPVGHDGNTVRSQVGCSDGTMADSSSGRYGEPPEEVRTGGNTPEYGIRQLADSISGGVSGRDQRGLGAPGPETGEQQDRQGATNQPGNRGEAGNVADSEGEFSQRVKPEGSGCREPQEAVGNRSGDGQLADSTESGLEGVGANSHQEGWQEPYGSVGLPSRTIPTWPPSPSDAHAWERVIRERPDLAPALSKEAESQFRRMDNGRSHRVDELKALGNGIVPAVVAEFLRRIT